MAEHRIYSTSFASIYPHYVVKAERKKRSRAEVDEIVMWMTGYDAVALQDQIKGEVSMRDFFAQAPLMNPARRLITGKICGVTIEEIDEPLMKEIRYLDKLIDELAKGRPMEKILRKQMM